MQHGACYIRVSTEDQTEFSPDAQLKAIKAYAKKNDIILTKQHIYVDEGISGKRADKRPAFMQMIATAKSKPRPFDVILVHKFDRFARSREDSVVYKSLLKKEANIRVVSITETIEDDKFSVILEAMLEAMAEYYSLNLAEEVKKGMTEKATRGEYQTTAPFGYKWENHRLVPEPKEAKLIDFIFNQYATQKMGLRSIAIHLNELGIKTKRGNDFQNRTVEYILNNPVYIGDVRWTPTGKTRRNYNNPDSIICTGKHEAIIDIGLWKKAQEVMKVQKEIYSKHQKSTSQVCSWINGLVKCDNCGRTLVNSGKKYMQCCGYASGVCKVSHCINTQTLENLILERLKETFQNNLEITIVPKAQDTMTANEIELLNDLLNKLDVRKQRIKLAYQDGIDTIEEYKENKTKIEEERKAIQKKLSTIKAKLEEGGEEGQTIIKRIKDVYTLLTDPDVELDIKYKTAHFLINKIVFYKAEKTISIEYK